MANHNPPTNGFDKRKHQINRKGRPTDFDGFRELAKEIAHEAITEVNGHRATVAEMILRKWASSNNPQLQRAFIEVAFGKVPDSLELSSKEGKEIVLKVVYDKGRVPDSFAGAAPEATELHQQPSEAQDHPGG